MELAEAVPIVTVMCTAGGEINQSVSGARRNVWKANWLLPAWLKIYHMVEFLKETCVRIPRVLTAWTRITFCNA